MTVEENTYVRRRAGNIHIYIGCRGERIEYPNSCACINHLYAMRA